MELFQYPHMQRALIAALVIGLAAPALGIYLVQRRLTLIGDGIGHVALTGVGAGLLLNRSPVLVAVIVATAGAIAIELVRAVGVPPATWPSPCSSTAASPAASCWSASPTRPARTSTPTCSARC